MDVEVRAGPKIADWDLLPGVVRPWLDSLQRPVVGAAKGELGAVMQLPVVARRTAAATWQAVGATQPVAEAI